MFYLAKRKALYFKKKLLIIDRQSIGFDAQALRGSYACAVCDIEAKAMPGTAQKLALAFVVKRLSGLAGSRLADQHTIAKRSMLVGATTIDCVKFALLAMDNHNGKIFDGIAPFLPTWNIFYVADAIPHKPAPSLRA
jgi:hypothetical protein